MTKEAVCLLHGLARSKYSMRKLGRALESRGLEAHLVGYPSQRYPIEVLAERYVLPRLERLADLGATDYVTHSMGGIIIRYLMAKGLAPWVRRVVMLAPPNQGSEIADALKTWLPYRLWTGPAGQQLGTETNGFVAELPPLTGDIGIIAGKTEESSCFDRYFSSTHDGKVTVTSTELSGSAAHRVISAHHSSIMNSPEVAEQTYAFLSSGHFTSLKPQ